MVPGSNDYFNPQSLRTPIVFTSDSKSVVCAASDGSDDEIYILTPGQKPMQLTDNGLNEIPLMFVSSEAACTFYEDSLM